MRCRRSVTGGLVMEIAGKESASKADILANKLRDVFHGSEEVRINRPVKKAELRILGLTSPNVTRAVSEAGGCAEAEISVGNIRQRTPNSNNGHRLGKMPGRGCEKDCSR
ncbi:hypothetical protein QLX08_010404 [Tetragonisca angustula]|uniref:Uncharacterized protein n=1 Tax=Tetragonisca angustula TaxID=166442 RepID=A0AAW0ZE95_9HYME